MCTTEGSEEMSKGRVGHTQGVTATIASRKINTTLLLLLFSLWKKMCNITVVTSILHWQRGAGIDLKIWPAPRRQGMSSALEKHSWHSFSTPRARINKAKLQRDKQCDSPGAPSAKWLLQVKAFRLNIWHLSPTENRWCPAKSELGLNSSELTGWWKKPKYSLYEEE